MNTTYTAKNGKEYTAQVVTQNDENLKALAAELKLKKIEKQITFLKGKHIYMVNIFESGMISREHQIS